MTTRKQADYLEKNLLAPKERLLDLVKDEAFYVASSGMLSFFSTWALVQIQNLLPGKSRLGPQGIQVQANLNAAAAALGAGRQAAEQAGLRAAAPKKAAPLLTLSNLKTMLILSAIYYKLLKTYLPSSRAMTRRLERFMKNWPKQRSRLPVYLYATFDQLHIFYQNHNESLKTLDAHLTAHILNGVEVALRMNI